MKAKNAFRTVTPQQLSDTLAQLLRSERAFTLTLTHDHAAVRATLESDTLRLEMNAHPAVLDGKTINLADTRRLTKLTVAYEVLDAEG